ncbi:phosphate ABC transporter permease PstA [Alishewanella sp. d11]|uniref:phosphate ABC transporter permease PstA n=1 Tax=Alishewanella sp. d11 TaxID=3414030 RepID=UPI003BF7BC4A
MVQNLVQGRVLQCFAALATVFILLLLCLLSLLMLSRGLNLFWPSELVQFRYQEAEQSIVVSGEIVSRQQLTTQQLAAAGYSPQSDGVRILLKQGYSGTAVPTFRWYWQQQISDLHYPQELALVRHKVLGDIFGTVITQGTTELELQLSSGKLLRITDNDIDIIIMSNQLNWVARLRTFWQQGWQFLISEPRDANSAGGILPAVVGTVVSVMLMAVLVAPIGIMAGVYLHEYAKDSRLVRFVRLSVHNLAGVPSIVFGVFGLGFFVYVLGGSIDQLFYAEKLPQPTFGSPGLIWVSLTLALLTLPVVIVATEEGLARIPQSLRLGGHALGATKAEVLRKLILPAARPAMITGIVLAISRAAGEVAPLIFVGVVKYAPTLPVSTEWPFIHIEQQIMSLGFHIYDVGLHSSNADAAEPRVYAIALVLLFIIGSLNLLAMRLRRYYQLKSRDSAF